MKNIISTLFLVGALALNSYSQKIEQNTELEKYNEENKQVYEDAKTFFYVYGKVLSTYEFYASLGRNDDLFLRMASFRGYYDFGLDGLGNEKDSYCPNNLFVYKRFKSFSEFPPKKQLKITKKYTKVLRKIMHKVKYPGY